MAYLSSDLLDSPLLRALTLANVLVHTTCTTLFRYRDSFTTTTLFAERDGVLDLWSTAHLDDASPVTAADRGHTRKRRNTLALEVNYRSSGAGYESTFLSLGGSGCGIYGTLDMDPMDFNPLDESDIDTSSCEPPLQVSICEPAASVHDDSSTSTCDAGSCTPSIVRERDCHNKWNPNWFDYHSFTHDLDYCRLLENLAYLHGYFYNVQVAQVTLDDAIAPPADGFCVNGVTYFSPFTPGSFHENSIQVNVPTRGVDEKSQEETGDKVEDKSGSTGDDDHRVGHVESATNIETTRFSATPEGSTTDTSTIQDEVIDENPPKELPERAEQSSVVVAKPTSASITGRRAEAPEWRTKRGPSGKPLDQVFNTQPRTHPLSGNTFLGIKPSDTQNGDRYAPRARYGTNSTSGTTTSQPPSFLPRRPSVSGPSYNVSSKSNRGSFNFNKSPSKSLKSGSSYD